MFSDQLGMQKYIDYVEYLLNSPNVVFQQKDKRSCLFISLAYGFFYDQEYVSAVDIARKIESALYYLDTQVGLNLQLKLLLTNKRTQASSFVDTIS